MATRVRKVNATMRVVDGESLLSPQLMDRIVAAVIEALDASHDDERSRRRDTKIGACCGTCGQHEGADE
jgi:hypothetical protein